jgi:hypothetical protein
VRRTGNCVVAGQISRKVCKQGLHPNAMGLPAQMAQSRGCGTRCKSIGGETGKGARKRWINDKDVRGSRTESKMNGEDGTDLHDWSRDSANSSPEESSTVAILTQSSVQSLMRASKDVSFPPTDITVARTIHEVREVMRTHLRLDGGRGPRSSEKPSTIPSKESPGRSGSLLFCSKDLTRREQESPSKMDAGNCMGDRAGTNERKQCIARMKVETEFWK